MNTSRTQHSLWFIFCLFLNRPCSRSHCVNQTSPTRTIFTIQEPTNWKDKFMPSPLSPPLHEWGSCCETLFSLLYRATDWRGRLVSMMVREERTWPVPPIKDLPRNGISQGTGLLAFLVMMAHSGLILSVLNRNQLLRAEHASCLSLSNGTRPGDTSNGLQFPHTQVEAVRTREVVYGIVSLWRGLFSAKQSLNSGVSLLPSFSCLYNAWEECDCYVNWKSTRMRRFIAEKWKKEKQCLWEVS